jgi:hypothetical protein
MQNSYGVRVLARNLTVPAKRHSELFTHPTQHAQDSNYAKFSVSSSDTLLLLPRRMRVVLLSKKPEQSSTESN